jgi:hypothetical protein
LTDRCLHILWSASNIIIVVFIFHTTFFVVLIIILVVLFIISIKSAIFIRIISSKWVSFILILIFWSIFWKYLIFS